MTGSENKAVLNWYLSLPVLFCWQKVYVDILLQETFPLLNLYDGDYTNHSWTSMPGSMYIP